MRKLLATALLISLATLTACTSETETTPLNTPDCGPGVALPCVSERSGPVTRTEVESDLFVEENIEAAESAKASEKYLQEAEEL